MFGVGGGEILVIALVAVILFGTDDLPKHMRKFMKAWNDFRGVTNDLQRSWLDVRDQVTRDILTERAHSVTPDPTQQNTAAAAEQHAQATDSEATPGSSQGDSISSLQGQTSSEDAGENSSPSGEPSALPQARPAAGALARDSLTDGVSASVESIASTSQQDPDKST